MLAGRIIRLNVTCGASSGCFLFKALGSIICKYIVTLIVEFQSSVVRLESCSQWGPLLYCFREIFGGTSHGKQLTDGIVCIL